MKIKKLPFSISLLLLTLFNVFSSFAFSFPSESLDLNSRHSYTFKKQQNTKATFTEEVSVSIIIEIASNPDYLTSAGISANSFYSSKPLSRFYTVDLWQYNPDLKQRLTQNIFPFQFFW